MNKNIYIIVVAVALIVVISGISIWLLLSAKNLPLSENEQILIQEQPASPNTAGQEQTNNSQQASTTQSATQLLSYQDALKIYGGANLRVQLSLNNYNVCIVNPANPVFKKGVKVMFDNRINAKTMLYLDGVAYSIPAYGYKIITLTTTKPLPHTMRVDCNKGKNNAQIILQK